MLYNVTSCHTSSHALCHHVSRPHFTFHDIMSRHVTSCSVEFRSLPPNFHCHFPHLTSCTVSSHHLALNVFTSLGIRLNSITSSRFPHHPSRHVLLSSIHIILCHVLQNLVSHLASRSKTSGHIIRRFDHLISYQVLSLYVTLFI